MTCPRKGIGLDHLAQIPEEQHSHFRWMRDISRFFPQIDQIFPGEALNPIFGTQDEGFSEFRSR